MSLPDRPAARKPRRMGLFLPWLLFLLLAGGWSVGWFVLRDQAVARLDAGVERLRASGYQVAWSERAIGGFPFRLDVTVSGLRLAEPSGWALAAPTMKAEAWIYRPDHWVLAAPAGVTLTRPDGGPVAVRAQALRASLAGLGARPPRLSVEGVEVRFEPAAGAAPYPIERAGRLALHLRPGPDDQGGVLFRVEGAKLRLEGLPARVAQGRPVTVTWDLTLSTMSAFRGPDWPLAVRRWRDAGGSVTVRRAEIRGGDAVLAGRGGPLTVGEDGRLSGALDAELKDADSGQTVLGGTIEMRDGRAKLGPFEVGPSPRVY
ncbi:MAG: DUF2125 domain-containing protein [Pseudomonadota bacterium]